MASPPSTLILPFRIGAHVSYGDAIRQYINTQYDQHPEMFRTDLQVIDALRRDAVIVQEAHPSGIKKLQAYAAQLVWMSGKFPIDIGVDFPWYPAFGYNSNHPIVRNNLKYELLNVLYNLAALYCHLAESTSKTTPEGIKKAASYFSQAAGVLSYMRTEVLPSLRMSNPPEDMDDVTLGALTQLCLAEAQECFWQKAVTDKYKDAIIAKLSIRVSDLYREAAEASIKSNAISTQWIHHMAVKQHHFAAAAQLRASADCLEKRKYGEEVARLREALACVGEGLKEVKTGQVNKSVAQDLNGLRKKIEEDLKRAERDNDVIYMKHIPTKAELQTLERANMAIPKCPTEVSSPCEFLGEDAPFGLPLFSKLVPFAVHLAVSIYEERRDKLVNKDIIQPLDDLSETLTATLDSYGLPGSLQALEKPLGLPPSLIQRAEEVRQANAVLRVEGSFEDIDKLVAADLETFDEGKRLLLREQEEDERMRQAYGDLWTRPSSKEDELGKKLWTRLSEIDNYFAASIPSDKLVRTKWAGIKPQLQILAGSDRALLDYVPSSRSMQVPETLRFVLGKLRGAYNQVQRLQSRRRRNIEQLREKVRNDDVRSAMIKEAARLEKAYPGITLEAATFDGWLEKRLDKMYEEELSGLARDEEEQLQAVTELERVNHDFEHHKRVVGGKGGKEREDVLQKLNSAYDKYKEILENVEAGRKFYNDLSKIVSTMFRDQAKTWVNERRLDAKSLEEEIRLPPLERARLTSPSLSQQHQSPQRQQQQDQQTLVSPAAVPIQVPVPISAASSQMSSRHDVDLMSEPDLIHEVSLHEVSILDSHEDSVMTDPDQSAVYEEGQQPEPSTAATAAQQQQQQQQQPSFVQQLSNWASQAEADAQPAVHRASANATWTPDVSAQFSALPPAPTKTPVPQTARSRDDEARQQSGSPQRRAVWESSVGIKFG